MIHPINFGPVLIGLAGQQDDRGPTRRSHAVQDSARILVAPPKANSVTIILDCCLSGQAGESDNSLLEQFGRTTLRPGVALLAACRDRESAFEAGGHGRFTSVLLNGLAGAAADIHGEVTAVGLHALAASSLEDSWLQQPVLKIHSQQSPVLRRCAPAATLACLSSLPGLFATADETIARPAAEVLGHPQEDGDTALVQAFLRAGLVSLRASEDGDLEILLTDLGRHYRQLADDGMFS